MPGDSPQPPIAFPAPTRPEPLEPRTLFAAPNITGIDTDGPTWDEGVYHSLFGSFADSDTNDRRTVVVNWGDGTPDDVNTLPVNVRGFTTTRHMYPDDETSVLGQPRRYTITVTVTVTDSTFQSDTETRQIQVTNVLPVVQLPGEFVSALEGAPFTLPSNLYDPGADIHTFNWHVTRGAYPDPVVTVFESTARDLVFAPPDEGVYGVSVDYRDDDGGARTAATKIWVTNTPPVVTTLGATEVGEGQPYLLELQATDVAADTIQRWTIDWGDGQVETINGNPSNAGHFYDGPGHYVIRASATDEDGTYGAAPLGVFWRAGDVDTSFGGPAAGRVVTDFPHSIQTMGGDAVALPDARLLVARDTWGGSAVEGVAFARFMPDGSFDPTFDGDGRMFVAGGYNFGQTLALQPDGKFLFAGVTGSNLAVMRFNADGSRDPGFGSAGVVTAPFGVNSVGDLLVLPDGKLLVPGQNNRRMLAVRFNADGSPDTAFGSGGRVEVPLPAALASGAANVALNRPGGGVVLVGISGTANAVGATSVAALRADGTLDPTFGDGGWAYVPLDGGAGGVAAAFQTDGKLVVLASGSSITNGSLLRFNPDGSPDTTFGTAGATSPLFLRGSFYSLALANGGKILAAGAPNAGVTVGRFNANGSPDATFGSGGTAPTGTSYFPGDVKIVLPPGGGGILVTGTYGQQLMVTRLTGSGAPDAAFGAGGKIVEDRLGPWLFDYSAVRSLHVLHDKKILAVGEGGNNDLLYLARYLPDGGPDLTFGDLGGVVARTGLGDIDAVVVDAAGKALVARGGYLFRFNADGSPDTAFNNTHPTFSPARHFTLAPDGKIVGTGLRNDDGGLVVLRFNPDGSPDTTFAQAGKFEGFPGFGSYYTDVKAVTVQPDGRIVVGGRGLVRLTAAGAPDPTFGGGDGFVPAAPFIPPGFEQYGRYNFVVVRGVAVDSGGRIATAWSGNQDESFGGYAVARYLPDGTLDPTFAGDGQSLYPGGIAERIAFDPRGRILVGGFGSDADTFQNQGYGFTTLRLLPDGTRDYSFGRDGVVAVTSAGTGTYGRFTQQLAVLDTGDVLLGGLGTGGRFLISRFRADDERAQTVDVWNTPPAANAGPDREAYPGTPITLTGTFTDRSPSDTHTLQWVVRDPGGGVVAQGTGPSLTFAPPQWNGRYTATFTVTDDDSAVSTDSAFIDVAPRVVGRHIFYNNSIYDGRDPNPGPSDDAAIAADKQALLPGASPGGFANLTGYSRGINGILFDIAGNLPMTALAGIAGGAGLKAGAGGDPATWSDVSVQPLIGIRAGAGVNGSDRVTLTWPDGAIRNTWLRVHLHAPPQIGLGFPDDVFFFGNLVGDTAGTTTAPGVDGTDLRLSRTGLTSHATITNPRDHNRDGRVNVLDGLMVRAGQGHALGAISNSPAPAPAPTRRRSTVRGTLDLSSPDVSI